MVYYLSCLWFIIRPVCGFIIRPVCGLFFVLFIIYLVCVSFMLVLCAFSGEFS